MLAHLFSESIIIFSLFDCICFHLQNCTVEMDSVNKITEHYWTCRHNGLDRHTWNCKRCHKKFDSESAAKKHCKSHKVSLMIIHHLFSILAVNVKQYNHRLKVDLKKGKYFGVWCIEMLLQCRKVLLNEQNSGRPISMALFCFRNQRTAQYVGLVQ